MEAFEIDDDFSTHSLHSKRSTNKALGKFTEFRIGYEKYRIQLDCCVDKRIVWFLITERIIDSFIQLQNVRNCTASAYIIQNIILHS